MTNTDTSRTLCTKNAARASGACTGSPLLSITKLVGAVGIEPNAPKAPPWNGNNAQQSTESNLCLLRGRMLSCTNAAEKYSRTRTAYYPFIFLSRVVSWFSQPPSIVPRCSFPWSGQQFLSRRDGRANDDLRQKGSRLGTTPHPLG